MLASVDCEEFVDMADAMMQICGQARRNGVERVGFRQPNSIERVATGGVAL